VHNNRSTEKLVLIEESPVSEVVESEVNNIDLPVARSGAGAGLIVEDNFDGSYKLTAKYSGGTQEVLGTDVRVTIPEAGSVYVETVAFFEEVNKTILLPLGSHGAHGLWSYDWNTDILEQMRVSEYIFLVREPELSPSGRYMLVNHGELYILDLLEDRFVELSVTLGEGEVLNGGGAFGDIEHHVWLNDNMVEYSVYDEEAEREWEDVLVFKENRIIDVTEPLEKLAGYSY